MESTLLAVFRFATFAGSALLFGMAPITQLVLRPAFSGLPGKRWAQGQDLLTGRLRAGVDGCLAAVATAAVGTLVVLVVQAAGLHTGGLRTSDVTATLASSFGVWTVLRVVLVVGFALTVRGQARSRLLADPAADSQNRLYWSLWLAYSLAIMATISLSGHAAAGSRAFMAIPVNLLHLLTASVWLSGVCLLTTALPIALRGRRARIQVRLVAPALDRFSQVAFTAVILTTLTGILNSLLTVNSFTALQESSYGQTLILKVWLFLWILALGGLNHFVLLRQLRRPTRHGPSQAKVAVSVAGEFLFGVLLLAVTAVLTGLAPPR